MRKWLSLLALAAPLQAAVPAPAATPAATAAAHPDLSGLWVVSNRTLRGNLDERFQPLAETAYLTPRGKAALAAVKPALDPSSMCLPSFPRHLGGPYPIEIVQNADRLVELFEWDSVFRIVYLDGRPHPDPDEDSRYMGHATAHWDGAALVVDTANFNGEAWLEGNGLPMSARAHVTEWYSLADAGRTLQVVMKVEDPDYLSRAIWRKYFFNLKPTWAIKEYLCSEGNRDNAFEQKEGEPGSISKTDVLGK